MTAVFAAAYPDRIEMLSDGATVREDGTIAILGNKAWMSDRLPIAFAGRGNYGALAKIGQVVLARLAMKADTVDEVIEAFAGELASGLPQVHGSQLDGIIGAISEADGPLLLYFTTSEQVPGCTPFKMYDRTPLCGVGSEPPDDELRAIGLPERLDGECLSEYGPDLFEVLRRNKMRHLNAGGHEVYGIGGHVDLTVVRPEGCTTTRLHSWPEDVVGKRIKPLAA